MILEKPKRVKDQDYLQFVRSHPCVIAKYDGTNCDGPVDAHHITERGQGKVGSKPSDRKTLPFCRWHHNLFHAIGSIETFEKRLPVILNYEMLRLASSYRAPKKAKREKQPQVLRIKVRCICAQKTHEFAPGKVNGGWDCPYLKTRVSIA